MDAVNAFNQELFSLMDMKPPISRAKMILITKAAIKAIKLYKHVVQIVEKFIKKCKPEYKVPGLYVIDSIVRQSRHQFGIDKDVFGPRFIKNLTATFQCLYLCPTEEKSKIVRVLNLWQKNGVFKIEIIQPLLDMAAGADAAADNSANDEGSSPPPVAPSEAIEDPSNSGPSVSVPPLPSSDAFAAVAQLFQTTQGQQLQQILQTFQQPPKPQSPQLDENVLAQVEAITSQLQTAQSQQAEKTTTFDKTLLDRFDYDDEPDAAEDSKKEASSPVHTPPQPTFTYPGDALQATSYVPIPAPVPTMDEFQPMMMAMQQESMQQEAPLPPNGQMLGYGMVPAQSFMPMVPPMISQDSSQPFQNPFQMQQNEMHLQQELQQEIQMEVEQPSNVQENKRPISEQQNAKSRSASRSPKRRRSRSGSRSRRSRHRRSRSRSRDRRRSSPKSRSQERREREKERERRQKGLPPIKPETVSVCSTTLWVGQLDKRTTQQDVSNLLEEFGAIESINMIPPRGCAYINMVQRQDAYRALQKLSRGTFKVNQKAIKIAWALNKGIKLEYKQYWDVEIGVTYIPWNKVKPEELESFCEGALLDNDTLCPEWKDFPKKTDRKNTSQNGAAEATRTEEITPVTQALPVMSVPIHGPMPAMPVPPHQPMPSLPHPGMSVSQVPSHQGLPLHQAMPAPGLHLPQGVVVPQGMPLPQGMLPLQGMLPPQGLPPGLQPPAFPGPINIPPPGFAPGIPPPPFMRPGFNPMQMPPGFLPPLGIPPPMAPLSIPPPTTGMNIPTSTAGDVPNDSSKEQSQGNPNQGQGSGRENMETDDDDNDEDDGNEFGSAPQERQNSTPGPVNPHHGAPHGGPSHGPPSSSSHGPPTGPQHGPPSGPQHGPPSGPQHGPQHGPPSGPQHGPPSGPQHGPPSGPQHGPPHGPMHGPPSGPPHGPPHGPSHGPPHGPPHRPPHGPGMGQAPSTGLLGARPGLIPLQRPPGTPTHMQRFPRPRMMHRGPPPGQGGFGMRGPFPPQGHFPRSRGQGGHGGSEEREDRPFRNERQGFNPNREQERFGRRPYGHRGEEEREYFGNRHDERDYERHSSRGRRSWSRGSPEYDHHRDSEERNRWSVGRERLPSREMERQENKSSDMAEYEEKHHDSFGIENVDPVPELQNEEPKPPGEESVEDTPTKNAAPVEQSENDSEPTEKASS